MVAFVTGTPSVNLVQTISPAGIGCGVAFSGEPIITPHGIGYGASVNVLTTQVPGTPEAVDANPLTLGMRWFAEQGGVALGGRFYKGGVLGGNSHTMLLYDDSGTELARGTSNAESASGWHTVTFNAPVGIAANTPYVIATFWPAGFYPDSDPFFTSRIDNGIVHAYSDAESPNGNGLFAYAATPTFPTGNFGSSNYFSDIIFASGAAFGGAPLAISQGHAAGFDIGNAPIAIPHGFAAGFGVGVPVVVRAAANSPRISGGLALAKWHYDELVAEWHRLRELREELEERQERLAREKLAQKRSRRRAVVDLDAERRLDALIIACNRAYAMLQEREDVVYAGVRAYLADVGEISTENRRALRSIEVSYSAMLQADDDDAILALM